MIIRVDTVVIPLPPGVLRDVEVDLPHARGTHVVDAITDVEIAIVHDNRAGRGFLFFSWWLNRTGRGREIFPRPLLNRSRRARRKRLLGADGVVTCGCGVAMGVCGGRVSATSSSFPLGWIRGPPSGAPWKEILIRFSDRFGRRRAGDWLAARVVGRLAAPGGFGPAATGGGDRTPVCLASPGPRDGR